MPANGFPSHLLMVRPTRALSWTSMSVRPRAVAALAVVLALSGCKPRTTEDAEAKHDVAWLAEESSPRAVASLGRLADSEP